MRFGIAIGGGAVSRPLSRATVGTSSSSSLMGMKSRAAFAAPAVAIDLATPAGLSSFG